MKSKKIIAVILAVVLSLQLFSVVPTMVTAEDNSSIDSILNDEGLWLTEVYVTDAPRDGSAGSYNNYEEIKFYETSEELMEFIEIASTYKDNIKLNQFDFYYNNKELNITNIDDSTEIAPGECVVIWNYRSDITGVELPTIDDFKSEMRIPETTKVLTVESGAEWNDDTSTFEIKKDDIVLSTYATANSNYNEEIGTSVELKVPDKGSGMDVYHKYSIPSPGTIDISAGHYDGTTTKTFANSQLNGIISVKDCTNEPSGVYITEIKALGTADSYTNYIEIYNTTDKEVNLNSDYCIKYFRREVLRERITIYDTVSGTGELSMSSADATCSVPAGGTAILMCCKKGSTTILEAPEVPNSVPIYYFKLTCYDGELGDEKRGVEIYKINDDTTETLISCYSYTKTDAWNNNDNAIHLKPNHDRPNMLWVAGTGTNPGSFKDSQITFDDDGGKLQIALDDSDDDYTDNVTAPKTIKQGEDLRVLFKTTPIKPNGTKSALKRTRTEMYYRLKTTDENGASSWSSWTQEIENHSGNPFIRVPEYYEAIITADKLFDADAVQFYIKAYNKYRATLSDVYQVEVTKPSIGESEIRTNISEGEYIKGDTAITANTGDSTQNGNLRFKIDNTSYTASPMLEDGAYLTFTLSERGESAKHALSDTENNLIKDLSDWYGMNPNGQTVKIDSSHFTYNSTTETFDTTLRFWAGTMGTYYNDVDDNDKIAGTDYTLNNKFNETNSYLYSKAIDWYTVDNLKLKLNGKTYSDYVLTNGQDDTKTVSKNEDVTTSFNVGATNNTVADTTTTKGLLDSTYACIEVSFSIPATDVIAVGIKPEQELSNGSHTLYIYHEDSTVASKTVSFTVDNTPPEIDTGIENEKTLSGNITIDPTITEANLESSITFLDGEAIETPLTTTANELGQGEHLLEVYAIDKAGNQNTESVTFTIETTNDSDTLTSSEENVTSGGAKLNVNLTDATNTTNKTVDFYVIDSTKATTNDNWDGFSRPANYDFAIAWQTDPQYYAEKYSEIYYGMNNWIVKNAEKWEIKYVINTGDLIDDLDMTYQWEIADKAMKIFDDAGMPYGVLGGNHDVAASLNLTDSYYKYFGKHRFKNQPTYGGSYKNNLGHYDIISQNGEEFLILYMSWNIYKDELDWMNKVLDKHSDKKAILCFHSYTIPEASESTTIPLDYTGKLIEQNVVAKNSNVIAVLNGHYHGSAYYIKKYDDNADGKEDRTVYNIAKDYQTGLNGGDGYIDMLYFNLEEDKVYINSYWTMAPKGTKETDKFNFFSDDLTKAPVDLSSNNVETYDRKVDSMTFNLSLNDEFTAIDASNLKAYIHSATKVNDNSVSFENGVASATVNCLKAETTYKWFAVVTDDTTGSKQIVPLNEFTTGARTLWGDTDNSGTVTVKDVTCIQLHLVWKKRLSDEAVYWSKVNGNETLDIRDATTIQMKLANLIDKFPVEN